MELGSKKKVELGSGRFKLETTTGQSVKNAKNRWNLPQNEIFFKSSDDAYYCLGSIAKAIFVPFFNFFRKR